MDTTKRALSPAIENNGRDDRIFICELYATVVTDVIRRYHTRIESLHEKRHTVFSFPIYRADVVDHIFFNRSGGESVRSEPQAYHTLLLCIIMF